MLCGAIYLFINISYKFKRYRLKNNIVVTIEIYLINKNSLNTANMEEEDCTGYVCFKENILNIVERLTGEYYKYIFTPKYSQYNFTIGFFFYKAKSVVERSLITIIFFKYFIFL